MLEEALNNRRWVWRDDPFPHVTARDVFKPDAYEKLVGGFRDVFNRGLAETGKVQDGFTRSMSGYDAYAHILTPATTGPLTLFVSQEWHDMLAKLFNVEAMGGVSVALHHHKVGGKNGRPHNDLNPGWFVEPPAGTKPGTVNIQDPSVNSYTNSKTFVPNVTAQERVRGVAILYYMNNPPWRPGEGGETGIYRAVNCAAEDAAVRVGPVNNSILAFEVSPWSYHGFISNHTHTRDAIVMWLHRSKADVARRWGEHMIVGWK
jgi:hypothetical protein